MKQLLAATLMTCMIMQAYAQTETKAAPSSDNREGAMAPNGAAGASAAAGGNLTALYVGAGAVGAAVIAGALSGGGSDRCGNCNGGNPGNGPAGGASGTTGTTGTH